MNDGVLERVYKSLVASVRRDIGSALLVLSVLGHTKEQVEYIEKYGNTFIEEAERLWKDDIS